MADLRFPIESEVGRHTALLKALGWPEVEPSESEGYGAEPKFNAPGIMKLVSSAVLPIVEGDLPKTLAGFVSLLRDHFAFDAQTRCTLHLMARSWKFAALVAGAIPPEEGEFQAYLSGGRKMTAAEWLAQTAAGVNPDNCSCAATLTDSLSRDQTLAVLSELAGALPVSGRGVHLMLSVDSAILSDASLPVRGRLWLARGRPSAKARYSSSVFCEFEADSKSGPVAKKTLQELRDALGVEWRKPSVMPDPDRADRPSPTEMAVVEQCIHEAFAWATADLDRAHAALTGVPLLYSEMGAFYKRMRDVENGVREEIDFIPEFRKFMQANFPDYSSCSMGHGSPTFRKRLAKRSAPRCRHFDLHVHPGDWAETGIGQGASRNPGDRSRREAFGELTSPHVEQAQARQAGLLQ